MELVDIVDENNEVIGKTTKYEAHKKGLLHRTIIAEVIDSKGRWLLVKQSSKRQDPSQYVSPIGGHITSGETEVEALKREAFEELRLTDKIKYKFISKFIFNRFVLNRQENHYFILYEVYSDEIPTLNYESESFKYFTVEEIKEGLKKSSRIFGAAFHYVVKNAYPHLGN